MRIRVVSLGLAMAAAAFFSSTSARAQVVGGYVVPGSPAIVGAPVVPGAPLVGGPIVTYQRGYSVMTPRPYYGAPRYGYGNWGYGPRVWGPGYGGYRTRGWGRRWW